MRTLKQHRKEAAEIKRVGGQALFNGVLMRGGGRTASAVRTENGIELSITYSKSTGKSKLSRIPVLRGIAAFAVSLGGVLKTARGKKNRRKAFAVAVCYAAFAAALILLGIFLEKRITASSWLVYNLIIAGVTVVELIVMLVVLRRIPACRRLFMYHAAEHMCINCYEKRLPLTVENVRIQSREHIRCGSNLVANVITAVLLLEIFLPPMESEILYLAIDLTATLAIFGIAYEGMRYAEKNENRLTRVIGFLGGLMQRYLTTTEPTDDMLECGIAAIKGVTEE